MRVIVPACFVPTGLPAHIETIALPDLRDLSALPVLPGMRDRHQLCVIAQSNPLKSDILVECQHVFVLEKCRKPEHVAAEE